MRWCRDETWERWAAPRGFGRFGGGGCGPGRHGGGWMRTGRILAQGDLRLVILALLAERPRHGYDLIRAIEERSAGAYSPSPGVIYPTLTFLEEAGYATVQDEGARKLYAITDAGRRVLEENRALADALLGRIAQSGLHRRHRHGGADATGPSPEERTETRGEWAASPVERALGLLLSAVRAATGNDPGAAERIARILEDAAAQLRAGSRPS